MSSTVAPRPFLKAFKMIDAPLAPQSRGSSLFSSGLTDDARQTFRNQLLDCTADKMRLAAEKYLIGGGGNDHTN